MPKKYKGGNLPTESTSEKVSGIKTGGSESSPTDINSIDRQVNANVSKFKKEKSKRKY